MSPNFHTELFVIAGTFLIYFLAQKLYQRTKFVLLNPVLVSMIIIILFLTITKIDYAIYQQGGKLIEFFLKPAVVALGVPLYIQLERIKKQLVPIILSQLGGCLTGIFSVVLIAKYLGASREVCLSLASKSVTIPIAVEVTNTIGGIPSLTIAAVIVSGTFGSVLGYSILKFLGVKNPISQGIAMGTAAHAVGTSKSMEISPSFGAYSSLGLIVNGILTALFTPFMMHLLDKWSVL